MVLNKAVICEMLRNVTFFKYFVTPGADFFIKKMLFSLTTKKQN